MKNNNFFLAISDCAYHAVMAEKQSAWWVGYNSVFRAEWCGAMAESLGEYEDADCPYTPNRGGWVRYSLDAAWREGRHFRINDGWWKSWELGIMPNHGKHNGGRKK